MLDLIEWSGVVCALIYIYLATKARRLCFLFGLISSLLFVLICGIEKLYFDTAINAYYVVMSVVGWYSWKSPEGESFEIRSLGKMKFYYLSVLSLILSFLLAFATEHLTDASLPYVDSFTTVFAVLATWMMVERFIQNWILWILADGVSVFLYIVKNHYPMAMLFAVYTVIAVLGYLNWKKLQAT